MEGCAPGHGLGSHGAGTNSKHFLKSQRLTSVWLHPDHGSFCIPTHPGPRWLLREAWCWDIPTTPQKTARNSAFKSSQPLNSPHFTSLWSSTHHLRLSSLLFPHVLSLPAFLFIWLYLPVILSKVSHFILNKTLKLQPCTDHLLTTGPAPGFNFSSRTLFFL